MPLACFLKIKPWKYTLLPVFKNITFDSGIYKVKGAQSDIEQFMADKFRGDWKAGKTLRSLRTARVNKQ